MTRNKFVSGVGIGIGLAAGAAVGVSLVAMRHNKGGKAKVSRAMKSVGHVLENMASAIAR